MNRYRIIFVSVFFLFSTIARVSGDVPDISTNTDNTEAVLLRIKGAASKVESLAGDFIQKKKVEILKEMPESRGKFYYKKPDCLRWEITEPVKMGFIVNGDQGKKWRDRADRFKRFDVSREPIIGVISGQVFAWAKGDLGKLKEGYEISILKESPIEVKLVPLSSVEKKYIASIILSFSGTDDYVEGLEINETRGGSTRITFCNIVTNQIEEDIF